MSDTALTNPRAFTDDELGEVTSFKDALALLAAGGVEAEELSDYGTGFLLLKDKRQLIGVDFAILEWRFNDSNLSEDGFVSLALVTTDGRKFIVNDGSTGIRRQLASVSDKRIERGHAHPYNGLMVRGGLTESTYETEDAKGNEITASTFYLSEAPRS